MIQAVQTAIASPTVHQTAAELTLKSGDSSPHLEPLVVEVLASKRSEVRVRVSIRQWSTSFYGLGFQLTTHGILKVALFKIVYDFFLRSYHALFRKTRMLFRRVRTIPKSGNSPGPWRNLC